MKINNQNITHLATSILRGSTTDHIEDKNSILKVDSNSPLTWNNGKIYLDNNLLYEILFSHAGSKITYTIPINVAPWVNNSLEVADQEAVFFLLPNNRTTDYTLVASDLKVDSITNLNTNYKLSTDNKNIIVLFYRDGEYLHNMVTKTVHKKNSTVILNALSEPSGFNYGVYREGDGGGAGDNYGLDLTSLEYLVSAADMFGHTDKVDLTNTTAVYNVQKEAFDIYYDSTKTATTIGTALTLSAVPSFVVQVGDIIWSTLSGNQEIRKIVSLGNINIDGTGATLDAAFSSDISLASCTISQLVSTKDLMNYYITDNEQSISNSNIVGHIFLNGVDNIPLDDVTYSEQPDWKAHSQYKVGDYILKENGGTLYETTIETVYSIPGQLRLTDTTNFGGNGNAVVLFKEQLNTCLVNYYDSGSLTEVNVAFQAITGQNTNTIWNKQYGSSRDINLGNSIQQTTIEPDAVGPYFYIRFFSNNPNNSGYVRLYEYQAAVYKEVQNGGPNILQAYAISDGSATHNCLISVVGGKTRISPSFTYTPDQNFGQPFGFLIVQMDGYEIPRYVSATLTPGPYYTEDPNGEYIDLDSDYSASTIDIAVLVRVGAPESIDIDVNHGIVACFSEAIVGDASDVTANKATHSSITSAIADVANGSKIYLLETIALENITIDKKVYLEGKGNQVVIGNIIFGAGSSSSMIQNVKINGDITINVGSDNIFINNAWQNSTKTFTDNGNNNVYIIIPE